jgi:hypothetical protein
VAPDSAPLDEEVAMTRYRPGRAAAALLALLAALALPAGLLSASAASAAVPGYVRLAHLSPDTPKVDVWVTSFKGSGFSKVFRAVGYGVVSDYQRLAPGTYTVAMRSPGAARDSDPLLRTNVTVHSGGAYTVAGVGRNSEIQLKVLKDDLSRPSPGTARMRVVQASSVAPVVNVSTTTGTLIAADATFPSTTNYAEVAAQPWTLKAQPAKAGVRPATAGVDVRSGTIYTALVLDKSDSSIQLVVHADAAAASGTPVGSLATGEGGTAGHGTPVRALVLLAGSLALMTVGVGLRRPTTG